MQNKVEIFRWSIRKLLQVKSGDDYFHFVVTQALSLYQRWIEREQRPWGRVLAVCATEAEARTFVKFPFEEIVVSGLVEANDAIQQVIRSDRRVSYRKENCEHLSLPSRSFDLIFCKEGLHHLARPVLGLYEMLRVCNGAVLLLEPYECLLNRLLQKLKLSSDYERDKDESIDGRYNYVFRWHKKLLHDLLSSYYLDSGFRVEIFLGWQRSRYYTARSVCFRFLAIVSGWLLGLTPGSRGNFMITLIVPGGNIPSDPYSVKL